MTQNQPQYPFQLALGGMLAMATAMGIGRFVYTPILPHMVQSLGLSAGQAGMIASSNFFGYLIGAMIAASSLLIGSPRKWLLGSLIASALSTLLMTWTDSYLQFLLVRFVGGMVSAWVLVFASALVIDRLAVAGRSALVATHFSGVGVGIACSAVITFIATLDAGDWRSAWFYSGLVSAITVLLVAQLISDSGGIKPTVSQKKNGAKSGHGWLLYGYGLFGFGYVITATFIVQLVRSAHYSTAVETWIWVLVGLSAAPSIWLWTRVAGSIGNSNAFSIACLVEAVGVGASVLAANLTGLIIAAVLLGGTFMGITAIGLVEARQRSSIDPRKTVAMMTVAFSLGQIIGPALAGYSRDLSGSYLTSSLLAAAALIIAAVFAQFKVRPV